MLNFAKFFKREGFSNEKRPYKKPSKTYILHGEKVMLAERQQMEEGLKIHKLINSNKSGTCI